MTNTKDVKERIRFLFRKKKNIKDAAAMKELPGGEKRDDDQP